jgi:hypothetical protein
MWLYRPSPDRWSIHEIIHHLADNEAIGYVQCRTFVAEPGGRLPQPSPARWKDSLGYFHQSTREAIEIISALRKMTHGLLANLPEPAWSHALEDANNGQTRLEDWFESQERYIPAHIDQILQTYDQWLKVNPPRKAPSQKPRSMARRRKETIPLGVA